MMELAAGQSVTIRGATASPLQLADRGAAWTVTLTKTNDAIASGSSPASPNKLEIGSLPVGQYFIDGMIVHNSPASAGFAVSLDDNDDLTYTDDAVHFTDGDTHVTGFATRHGFAGDGTNRTIWIRGLIRVTLSGTIALGWAQNVADPSGSQLIGGSYLRLQQVLPTWN